MDEIIKQFNFERILIAILVFQATMKAIRDAVDSTPATDDTPFERIQTIINKAIGYIIAGKRAK